MNLLAVFCYITLACDQSPGTQQAAPAVATPLQTRAPASTSRTPAPTNPRSPAAASPSRSPTAAVALAVDGGSVAQQLQQQQQQQRGKTVRETELSTYPTRYDYIDVEAVMNNERIIKILFNCVLNRGPCTREGLELKRIIPDAIQTECAKCSERQKKQAGKALAHLLTYKPEYWKTLVQNFDPNNVYLKRFMADDDEDEKITTSKAD